MTIPTPKLTGFFPRPDPPPAPVSSASVPSSAFLLLVREDEPAAPAAAALGRGRLTPDAGRLDGVGDGASNGAIVQCISVARCVAIAVGSMSNSRQDGRTGMDGQDNGARKVPSGARGAVGFRTKLGQESGGALLMQFGRELPFLTWHPSPAYQLASRGPLCTSSHGSISSYCYTGTRPYYYIHVVKPSLTH